MYLSKAVANYFIDKAEECKVELTPLKLIKLVYIAHGWYLAFEEKPLIKEYVEAWQYGPVIAELYHSLKHYGNKKIKGHVKEAVKQGGKFVIGTPLIPENDVNTKGFLDTIWGVYSDYSALQLSELTHSTGSPWELTIRDMPKYKRNVIIEDEVIQEHYEKRVKK